LICTPDTKWKYLRETTKKYFDAKKNTSLDVYLSSIFPDYEFQYNSSIKKSELPDNIRPRRYICDAISREHKLVVEFDGVNHYMDTKVVLNDLERDKWFQSLGYIVVRIPYWIQLSSDVIHDLFHVEVHDKFCELNYSFYFPETKSVDPNILPGNMCELGRERFIREFNKFSTKIQVQILEDLLMCLKNVDDSLVEYFLPKYVFDKLDTSYLQDKHEDCYNMFLQSYNVYGGEI